MKLTKFWEETWYYMSKLTQGGLRTDITNVEVGDVHTHMHIYVHTFRNFSYLSRDVAKLNIFTLEEREDLFVLGLPASKCSAKEVHFNHTFIHFDLRCISLYFYFCTDRRNEFVWRLVTDTSSFLQVSQIVRDTVRVLRLQYKTLAKAFSSKNSSNLNEFFSRLFLDVLVWK